jgi:hypothetical protein
LNVSPKGGCEFVGRKPPGQVSVGCSGCDVEANIQEPKNRLLEQELDDFERSWNKLYRPKHSQGWISLTS